MTREYVIKIEMPDGDDMSSAYLQDILQDIIQTDFDVEDKGRWKVSVKEKQQLIDKAAEWFRYRFPKMSDLAIEKFKEDMKRE